MCTTFGQDTPIPAVQVAPTPSAVAARRQRTGTDPFPRSPVEAGWGDNEPYYADANAVARVLFGTTMLGNVMGDQVVGLQKAKATPGLLPQHLLTTGLEFIYEGITIATIQPNETKWDTAGTGRYVKNAAAWLVNVERFGDAVVAKQLQPGVTKHPH